MDLGQNRILTGNHTKSEGLIVSIDANEYYQMLPVNLNATSQWKNNSLYSKNRQYLVNIEDNTLYSTSTYNLVTTLNQDFSFQAVMMDRLSSEQTITQCLRTPLFMKKGKNFKLSCFKRTNL
jgi:hypothetical protein